MDRVEYIANQYLGGDIDPKDPENKIKVDEGLKNADLGKLKVDGWRWENGTWTDSKSASFEVL